MRRSATLKIVEGHLAEVTGGNLRPLRKERIEHTDVVGKDSLLKTLFVRSLPGTLCGCQFFDGGKSLLFVPFRGEGGREGQPNDAVAVDHVGGAARKESE